MGTALTLSGNEITDAVRNTGTQGDGRAAPGGVGVWSGTTNLCTNGGFETNTTGWTQVSSTLTQDATWAKFGVKSGKIVTSNLTANEGAYITFVAAGSAVHAGSAWARVASGSGTIRARIADNTGATITAGSTATLSSTPQRVSVVSTALTNGTTYRLYLETNVQQALTFWIDGAQPESKAYPTPYVETNGATASRSASRVQLPSSGVVNQSQFWLAARLRMGMASSQIAGLSAAPSLMIAMWENPTGNQDGFQIRYRNASSAWRVDQVVVGVSHAAESAADTWSAGDMRTVVGAFSASAVKVSLNGAAFVSTAVSSTPTMTATTVEIGTDQLFTNESIDSDFLWLAAGTGTLANADAATINGYGNTAPEIGSWPGTPTFVWQAPQAIPSASSAGATSISATFARVIPLTAATSAGSTSISGTFARVIPFTGAAAGATSIAAIFARVIPFTGSAAGSTSFASSLTQLLSLTPITPGTLTLTPEVTGSLTLTPVEA